jgi:hypothetical protein
VIRERAGFRDYIAHVLVADEAEAHQLACEGALGDFVTALRIEQLRTIDQAKAQQRLAQRQLRLR